MACLDNTIGLRNTCGDSDHISSDTGIYLNDLQGIDLASIDNAINEEQVSAVQEIQRAIALSKAIVTQEVRGHLATRYEMPTLLDGVTAGEFPATRQSQAAQAYNAGVQFRMHQNDHAALYITNLRLLVNYTGDVDVKLWNLYTGQAEQTETIACTAGQIAQADVLWSLPNNGQRGRYFVGYDATSVPTWKTNIGARDYGGCNCAGGSIKAREVYVSGSKVTGDVLAGNLVSEQGTSGLAVTFSVSCVSDYLLCSLKQALALPLLYKTGEQLAYRIKHTKRLNRLVAYMGDYQELIEYFEREYAKHMTQLMKHLVPPSGPCFTTTNPTQFKASF